MTSIATKNSSIPFALDRELLSAPYTNRQDSKDVSHPVVAVHSLDLHSLKKVAEVLENSSSLKAQRSNLNLRASNHIGELRPGEHVVFGRKPPDGPQAFQIIAPTVSRAHVMVERIDENRFRVRDCGSKNGTQYRGGDGAWHHLKDMFLPEGARIRLGSHCEIQLGRPSHGTPLESRIRLRAFREKSLNLSGEPILSPARLPLFQAEAGEVRHPHDVRVAEEGKSPNFAAGAVQNYLRPTALDGPVRTLVYLSNDGTLRYSLNLSHDRRIYIARVEDVVRKVEITANELTMPRYVSCRMLPVEYQGAIHPQSDRHVDAWAYVREIPLVQEWYRGIGQAVP